LTTTQKGWLAGGVYLAWSSVVDVGLIPHRAVSDELPPVAFGAVVGCAAALAVLAVATRLRLSSRWMRFRNSDRWMGRPRFVDPLAFLVVYSVAYQLYLRLQAHPVAHLGELFLGLLDGGAIAAFVMHALRRQARPPDGSHAA
jgi:hypothetical protein